MWAGIGCLVSYTIHARCIYSDEWTTVDGFGERKCGSAQHTQLMQRARGHGGMVALAPIDTQHNACSDIPALFAENMGWFLKHLGFSKGQVTPLQQLLRCINGVLQAAAYHADCPALAPNESDWRAAGQPGNGAVGEQGGETRGAGEGGVSRVCVPLSESHVDAVVARYKACTSMLEWTLPGAS